MSADKVKQIVASAALVGGVVWTPLGDYINAAGGQAEIVAAVVAVWTVVHGVIDYAHGKASGGN